MFIVIVTYLYLEKEREQSGTDSLIVDAITTLIIITIRIAEFFSRPSIGENLPDH